MYTDFEAKPAKFDSEDGYVHWLVIHSIRVAVSSDQTAYAVVLSIPVLKDGAFRTLGKIQPIENSVFRVDADPR